jgi:hypothetical protein
MSASDLNELKRRLRAEGFEIYRTREGRVSLAERVRDNLILDSGIAVGPLDSPHERWNASEGEFDIHVTVRAQASHFPRATPDAVAARANELAEGLTDQGYQRESNRISGLPDPGDPKRILDTSYEVVLRRVVRGLDELFQQVHSAFSSPRASSDD